MKDNYDLTKLKKRPKKSKADQEVTRTSISIKLDSETLGDIKTEAVRMGMPYQTLINSILYRYANRDLIDRKDIDLLKIS
jgi:predicted DNA binding CopG/RHH family protein